MSYLVFARKWRPLTFSDVVGQEHITTTLQKAIEKNRVAHSYIFSGTRGVGKTTMARILARTLNCKQGPTINPCGICESCKSILSGTSFDVIEIDGASNNGVDNIRELRENIGYASMAGKYKIFIIDEVHMLTKGAFNALLKTLEEPPSNVLFIFATTEPQKIPETIHSRCQRYDFKRITTEQIANQLIKICNSETMAFENSAVYLIAERADGSMRDALSFMDQVSAFCQDSITEKEVRSILGIVEKELYETVVSSIVNHNPLPVLNAIEEVLNRGYDLSEFVIGLQHHLRSILLGRLPGVLSTGQVQAKGIDTAIALSEFDILRMAELLKKTEQEMKWSALPRFCVETTLLKLTYMERCVTIQEILASTGKNENPSLHQGASKSNECEQASKKKLLNPLPCIVESDESAQTVKNSLSKKTSLNHSGLPESPSKDPLDIRQQWPHFLELLIAQRPHLGTSLSMGTVIESTNSSVHLLFSKNLTFQYLEVTKKQSNDYITKQLCECMKQTISLQISLEESVGDAKQSAVQQVYTQELQSLSVKDDVLAKPIIQRVIQLFDAEVL